MPSTPDQTSKQAAVDDKPLAPNEHKGLQLPQTYKDGGKTKKLTIVRHPELNLLDGTVSCTLLT